MQAALGVNMLGQSKQRSNLFLGGSNMKQPIKLKWYSDPSHAWLRVLRKDAKALGILNFISGFSYQSKNGNVLYLEEDRDATLFLNALIAQGDKYDPQWGCRVDEKDRLSGIRKYDSFITHRLPVCYTVYRKQHNLWVKVKLVNEFIVTVISSTFKPVEPDPDYPWGIENYYEVLERARSFIKDSGYYAYHDDEESLIVTNSRQRMVLDCAKVADKITIIHVK
jgi:hypothetical protein